MPLGPIEVVVIAFEGNRFDGRIVPELQRLLDSGTITIVDGVFVTKDAAGDTTFVELVEEGLGEEAATLAALFDEMHELVSDEDVEELAATLEPDSSAAILAFEHTWVRPLRDAIVDAGGELVADFRVPRDAVDEVMSALATAG